MSFAARIYEHAKHKGIQPAPGSVNDSGMWVSKETPTGGFLFPTCSPYSVHPSTVWPLEFLLHDTRNDHCDYLNHRNKNIPNSTLLLPRVNSSPVEFDSLINFLIIDQLSAQTCTPLSGLPEGKMNAASVRRIRAHEEQGSVVWETGTKMSTSFTTGNNLF